MDLVSINKHLGSLIADEGSSSFFYSAQIDRSYSTLFQHLFKLLQDNIHVEIYLIHVRSDEFGILLSHPPLV